MRISLSLALCVLSLACPADAQDVCPMQTSGASAPRPGGGRGPGETVRIPVFFHIITGPGRAGDVSPARIRDQVEVLNQSFMAGGVYSFELIGVNQVENAAWFSTICYASTCAQGMPERNAKQALAQDPRHVLNVYSVDLVGDLVGMATYPFDFTYPVHGFVPFDQDNYLNGVIIDYTTFPGGIHPRQNLGDNLVHEVGHYLGLYHPDRNTTGRACDEIAGSCGTMGDEVCDTPQLRELSNNGSGVPMSVCRSGTVDNTYSFMNLTEDFYRTRFTPNQHLRMNEIGRAHV